MKPLTEYVALVANAYPDLPIQSARMHTDDGQFNVILFINEDLVLRFPRNAHVAEAYSGQVELLRWLAGRLPLATPTPSFESPRDVGWEARFFGYRRIAGEPLDAEALAGMGAADLDAIASQLAAFLRALHQNTAADLPVGIPASDPLVEWEPRVAGMRELLFPHMRPDARRWADAHLTSGLALLRAAAAPLALRHGDFGGSNIL
jgi:aminoglycoside 2''-phosphotransferase